MAFDNPTTNSQDLGSLLDGMNKRHHEQEAASDHLRNELLVAGTVVVAGAALWATHGRIGEGIARLANEETFLGRTSLKVADGMGSNTAALKLGNYFTEMGDLSKAESIVAKAANRGSADAQFRMSEIVLHQKIGFGQGTESQWNQFYDWTEKAAVGGNPRAQLNYAYRLGADLGNEEGAFRYLNHAASAKYPRAMAELGKFYEAGNATLGLAPNADKAEELYRAAAASGDSVGETQLSRFLSHTPLSDADWTFSLKHEIPAARGLQSELEASELPQHVSNPDLLQGIRDTANKQVMGGPGKPHLGDAGNELLPANRDPNFKDIKGPVKKDPSGDVSEGLITASPTAAAAIEALRTHT